MKRIYTMLGAAMMLLAVSCTDKDEFGLSEFVVNTEFQQADNGAKVNFTADGLWWDQNGDYLYINGTAVSLVWDDDNSKWKTTAGAPIDPDDNGYYNVIYKGGADDNNSVANNYSGGVYTGVDFTNTIPLAAQTNNNNITLYPCCAVIRIVGNEDGAEVRFEGGTTVPTQGNISCSSQTITSVTSTGESCEGIVYDGSTYIVIPISGTELSTKLTIETYNDGNIRTTPNAVQLKKGYIYVL